MMNARDVRAVLDGDKDVGDFMDEAMRKMMEYVGEAFKIIESVNPARKGEDWQGVIECPACGKDLHVCVVGSYNGHTHGRCSTPHCLNWSQ